MTLTSYLCKVLNYMLSGTSLYQTLNRCFHHPEEMDCYMLLFFVEWLFLLHRCVNMNQCSIRSSWTKLKFVGQFLLVYSFIFKANYLLCFIVCLLSLCRYNLFVKYYSKFLFFLAWFYPQRCQCICIHTKKSWTSNHQLKFV